MLGFTQKAKKRRGGRTWWVPVAPQRGGARGDDGRCCRRGGRGHRLRPPSGATLMAGEEEQLGFHRAYARRAQRQHQGEAAPCGTAGAWSRRSMAGDGDTHRRGAASQGHHHRRLRGGEREPRLASGGSDRAGIAGAPPVRRVRWGREEWR